MNKIIILDNKKCQALIEDPIIFNKLRKHLSFRMAGVEFTAAFQNGWNGITYLINPKGFFSSGLLSQAQEFLIDNGLQLEIEDRRIKPIISPPLDISKKLLKYKLVPRDYQERIVETALQHQKGIIRAATGSGKSLCISLLTARLNKPTNIYVIGLDLLQQFHDLLSKLFKEKIGFVGNGVCDIQRINVCSIWTIGRSLNISDKDIIDDEENQSEKYDESNKDKILKMLQIAQVHLIDECHLSTTNTIKAIYDNINPEYIFGFSGTPYRDDGSTLLINGILGDQIIDVSASELIAKGVLAQPIIKFISVPAMKKSGDNYQSVYKNYIVDNDARNQLILSSVKELVNKKYTILILFKQIRHGEILYENLIDAGINCEILNGKDDLEYREEVKDKINSGEVNVLIASTIFDLGIDLPVLSALILCGGGKSSIRALQRIGRVIRAYPGKKFSAVVDFYDQTKYLKNHSKIRNDIYCSENGFKVIPCKEMK